MKSDGNSLLSHYVEHAPSEFVVPVAENSAGGFTLVELMIVVAIIGVLVTVGVPTFKKMVQKAKKSEAKVSLGALHTVENAFFSEYGAFGSNIGAVGFALDGASATRTYHVGFGTGSCDDASKITLAPTSTSGVGSQLQAAFPTYFSGTYIGVLETKAASAPTSGCKSGVMPSDGRSFLATANGMISAAPGAQVDQWSLTNDRVLSNDQDGMR